MRYVFLFAALALVGCAPQQYWVKPGTDVTTASADLADCRKGAANMMMMEQLEPGCMTGKGYHLTTTP